MADSGDDEGEWTTSGGEDQEASGEPGEEEGHDDDEGELDEDDEDGHEGREGRQAGNGRQGHLDGEDEDVDDGVGAADGKGDYDNEGGSEESGDDDDEEGEDEEDDSSDASSDGDLPPAQIVRLPSTDGVDEEGPAAPAAAMLSSADGDDAVLGKTKSAPQINRGAAGPSPGVGRDAPVTQSESDGTKPFIPIQPASTVAREGLSRAADPFGHGSASSPRQNSPRPQHGTPIGGNRARGGSATGDPKRSHKTGSSGSGSPGLEHPSASRAGTSAQRRAESPASASRAFSALDMMPSLDSGESLDGASIHSEGDAEADNDSIVSGSVGSRSAASNLNGRFFGVSASAPSGGAAAGRTSPSTLSGGGGRGRVSTSPIPGSGGVWDFLPGRASIGPSPMSNAQPQLGDTSSVGIGASDVDDDEVGASRPDGFGGAVGAADEAGNAWDRRGDRASRDKAHRKARAELRRFTNNRKFPLNVGAVQVHSLGKIKSEPGFYALGRLAPIGFKASRTDRSPADGSLVHSVLDVIEVPVDDGPSRGADGQDTDSGSGNGVNDASNDGGSSETHEATPAGASTEEASARGDETRGSPTGGEGGGGDAFGGRRTAAAFRVTVSTLKKEIGKFQEFSAGRAWRAAMRSVGAEVEEHGKEDVFPSFDGDGNDVADDVSNVEEPERPKGINGSGAEDNGSTGGAEAGDAYENGGGERAGDAYQKDHDSRQALATAAPSSTAGATAPESAAAAPESAAAAAAAASDRASDDDGNTTREASDDEEHELRREIASLLHARAGARARVDANSTAIFDITGEVSPAARSLKPERSSASIPSSNTANGRANGGVGKGGIKDGAPVGTGADWGGGEVGSSKDGSLWYAGFFPPSVCRLLEGLALVDECKGYVFEVHRAEKAFKRVKGGSNVTARATAQLAAAGFRNMGFDGRTTIEQLSDLERRSDPDSIDNAGVWTSSYAVVEREMKALAKERRQKAVEEERERKKEAKAAEAVAKKAELEEKKMDRVYKKLEEKVLREQAKDREKMSRHMRRMFESELLKRKAFAKLAVQTKADAEGLAAILKDDACEGLECHTEEERQAEHRDDEVLQAALATARKAQGQDGLGVSNAAADKGTFSEAAAAAAAAAGGEGVVIPSSRVVLQELGLSQQQVADALQLWDFLHCFREPLAEAGFSPRHPPSLERLAQALKAVDVDVEEPSLTGRAEALSQRRHAVALLSGIAAALAGLATPSAVRSLGMTSAEAADPELVGALHGPFAWAEMSRTALCLHALREVGRDDKDLQPLILGGGSNPANNKDLKAMLTEADRKTIKLLRMRLEHRWELATADKGSIFPHASAIAAATAAFVHTCPYTGAGALRMRLYSPGEAWCGPGDWRFHLLSIVELDPYTPHDKATIITNLRAAVHLISHAAGLTTHKKRRGEADKPAQVLTTAQHEAAQAAEDVTDMRQFSALKGMLEAHPERFPSPADDTVRVPNVDVPKCHAAAVAIVSSLDSTEALVPPVPSKPLRDDASSSDGTGDGGKAARDRGSASKRPRAGAESRTENDEQQQSPATKRVKTESEVSSGRTASSARGWLAPRSSSNADAGGSHDGDEEGDGHDDAPAGDGDNASPGGEDDSDDDSDDEEYDDDDDEWMERGLRKGAPEVVQRCFKVLVALASQPGAVFFLAPMDPAKYMTYYETVAEPLAFSQLAKRLRSHAAKGAASGRSSAAFHEIVRDFSAGVRHVFLNAVGYNPPLTPPWLAARKQAAVFERLLLDWVLDPKAPPVAELDDERCSICRQPPKMPVDDIRIMCDRCDAKCHIHCLHLAAVPDGDWFCSSCVTERDVPYSLAEDNTARMKSATPSDENATGGGVGGGQGVAGANVARSVGAAGFKGWGVAGGKEGLPAALDPAVSLKARQLQGINPELDCVVRALVELGEGGERRGKDGWLTVLTALMQVACNTSEAVQKQLVVLDTEANEAVKASLDELDAVHAASGNAAGATTGGASTAGAERHQEDPLLCLPKALLLPRRKAHPTKGANVASRGDGEEAEGEGVEDGEEQEEDDEEEQEEDDEEEQEEEEEEEQEEDDGEEAENGENNDNKRQADGTSIDRGEEDGSEQGVLGWQVPTRSAGSSASTGEGSSSKAPTIKLKLVVQNRSSSPSPGGIAGSSAASVAAAAAAAAALKRNPASTAGVAKEGGSDPRQERRRHREETLAAQAFYAELLRLPGMPSKQEARRLLKDAMPAMADVPSPPMSPSRCSNDSPRVALSTGAASSGEGGGIGDPDANSDRSRHSETEEGTEERRGGHRPPGEGGDELVPAEAAREMARCAFCGDAELALCSTLVEAPTWEESVREYRQVPAPEVEDGSSNDDELTTITKAARRRIQAMGILRGSSGGGEPGLDINRCQWLPVDKSIRAVELQTLSRSLSSPGSGLLSAQESNSGDDAPGVKTEERHGDTSGETGDNGPRVDEAYLAASSPDIRIIRGSLIAHEICTEGMLGLRATAIKRSRDKVRLKALTLAAMNRWGGRSLPLGTDREGRQYMTFPAEPLSVYVKPPPAASEEVEDSDKRRGVPASGVGGGDEDVWKVFTGKAAIAGLLLGLSPRLPGERWLQTSIIRHFPEAVGILRDPAFPRRLAVAATSRDADVTDDEATDDEAPRTSSRSSSAVPKKRTVLNQKLSKQRDASSGGRATSLAPGDLVWVSRRRLGGLLITGSQDQDKVSEERWKAVVKEVRLGSSGNGNSSTASGGASERHPVYLVSFKGWSRRFDRWETGSALSPARDDDDESLNVRGEATADGDDDATKARGAGVVGPVCPENAKPHQRKVMAGLEATWYMDKPGRARGVRCSIPSCTEAETESSARARAKAMILTIQAALPNGARLRARGRFDASMLQPWTREVEEATTALQLMEAWLLLETRINPRWVESSCARLFSILPSATIALETATYSSVCLRVWVMDRCLQYSRSNATVDDGGMSEIASSMLPQQSAGRRKKAAADAAGGYDDEVGVRLPPPPASTSSTRGTNVSAMSGNLGATKGGRRLTKLSGAPLTGTGAGASRRGSPASTFGDDFTDDDASQHSGPPSPPPLSASLSSDAGAGGTGSGSGSGASGSGRKGRATKKRRR